jgi:ketosteroid isomerase-like protein
VERSNLDALRSLFADTQGVDVADDIRASVRGDAVSPEMTAVLAGLWELIDPDVMIDVRGAEMIGLGVFRGRAGVREFWAHWGEEWEHYSWSHSEWMEAGDRVFARVDVRATGRASGAEAQWHHFQVWEFRDGKIVNWWLFSDRDAAVEVLEG